VTQGSRDGRDPANADLPGSASERLHATVAELHPLATPLIRKFPCAEAVRLFYETMRRLRRYHRLTTR
jgi:hypothetical protein